MVISRVRGMTQTRANARRKDRPAARSGARRGRARRRVRGRAGGVPAALSPRVGSVSKIACWSGVRAARIWPRVVSRMVFILRALVLLGDRVVLPERLQLAVAVRDDGADRLLLVGREAELRGQLAEDKARVHAPVVREAWAPGRPRESCRGPRARRGDRRAGRVVGAGRARAERTRPAERIEREYTDGSFMQVKTLGSSIRYANCSDGLAPGATSPAAFVPMIEVEALTKQYGGFTAVRNSVVLPSSPARSWGWSARTAPARRRRSGASRGSSRRPRAR